MSAFLAQPMNVIQARAAKNRKEEIAANFLQKIEVHGLEYFEKQGMTPEEEAENTKMIDLRLN